MKLTFGKYEGKTLAEVAKIDIHYLIWLYWNTFDKKYSDNRQDQMNKIQIEIEKAGFSVFDKKKELLETVKFGKHKGKKFEDLIQKEGKWFLWMLGEAKDQRRIDYSLVYTLEYWMKKNGCKLFDGSTGLVSCKCCKTMHNIQK